jgi:hypothetical protein
VALLSSQARTFAGDAVWWTDRYNAAAPLTSGAAQDVAAPSLVTRPVRDETGVHNRGDAFRGGEEVHASSVVQPGVFVVFCRRGHGGDRGQPGRRVLTSVFTVIAG